MGEDSEAIPERTNQRHFVPGSSITTTPAMAAHDRAKAGLEFGMQTTQLGLWVMAGILTCSGCGTTDAPGTPATTNTTGGQTSAPAVAPTVNPTVSPNVTPEPGTPASATPPTPVTPSVSNPGTPTAITPPSVTPSVTPQPSVTPPVTPTTLPSSEPGASSDPESSSSAPAATTEPTVEPMPRTVCPDAPPATSKPAAADWDLAVSKDEYPDMLERMEPFEGSRGSLPWHLYTPDQAKAAAGEQFPLVVVLHGGYGREVDDGNILVDVAQYLLGSANGLLTEANRTAHPAYILLPHCRVSEGCNFGSNEWASTGGANFQVQAQPSVAGATALELIAHVLETYQVDASRVYLTGNSMGGGGTWEFAQRHPEMFAAVFPVSGHTPNLSLLSTIIDAKLPVWAFGAENDYTNPYTDTVNAIKSISDGGGCAWLTTFTGAGHDDALWSSPYLEAGLWPWVFAQQNPSYGL